MRLRRKSLAALVLMTVAAGVHAQGPQSTGAAVLPMFSSTDVTMVDVLQSMTRWGPAHVGDSSAAVSSDVGAVILLEGVESPYDVRSEVSEAVERDMDGLSTITHSSRMVWRVNPGVRRFDFRFAGGPIAEALSAAAEAGGYRIIQIGRSAFSVVSPELLTDGDWIMNRAVADSPVSAEAVHIQDVLRGQYGLVLTPTRDLLGDSGDRQVVVRPGSGRVCRVRDLVGALIEAVGQPGEYYTIEIPPSGDPQGATGWYLERHRTVLSPEESERLRARRRRTE